MFHIHYRKKLCLSSVSSQWSQPTEEPSKRKLVGRRRDGRRTMLCTLDERTTLYKARGKMGNVNEAQWDFDVGPSCTLNVQNRRYLRIEGFLVRRLNVKAELAWRLRHLLRRGLRNRNRHGCCGNWLCLQSTTLIRRAVSITGVSQRHSDEKGQRLRFATRS